MRGLLTAAYKHPIYAEQAVNLALSFHYKKVPIPISIVVDALNYEYLASKKYIQWFDKVIVLGDDQLYDFIGKLYSALQTPYTDTIYFDSDCLLVRNFEVFDAEFEKHSFCVAGTDMIDGTYAGKELKHWLQHNQLSYIPIFNAGIFRFTDATKFIIERALEIMKSAEKFQLPRADGGLNEQVAIGIALAENGLHAIPFSKDWHFSCYNANSNLNLDIESGVCQFVKENISRSPLILHYTPLYHSGYYFSRSRKVLMREINRLRAHYGLGTCEYFKPDIRDFLAILRRGRWPIDRR